MENKEIYAVICDNDGVNDPRGPLILETYIKFSSLQQAKERLEAMEKQGRYGKCRLGKVELLNKTEE